MSKKTILTDAYYTVSLDNVSKEKLKKGQPVYLRDDFAAACVKLHPHILPFLDSMGNLAKDGCEYKANWVEVDFETDDGNKTITVCDAYLDVLFNYTPIERIKD
jgi:hypothetical protein